jgi:hypothetical protein
MKRNYQGVLERIKQVALAHPQVNSADDGRELEFDVNKTELWPRAFIRTETGALIGGEGSAEFTNDFTLLIMDRLNTDRSNTVDVLNSMHSILADVIATLNNDQLIRVEDGISFTPLYDYMDAQAAGWQAGIRAYLDTELQCYEVVPAPEIAGTNQFGLDVYVDLSFSQGVYGDVLASMPVDAADFSAFDFVSGRATGVTITGATKTDNNPLTGGESDVRLLLSFTGIPNGTETFVVGPADGNSIFNTQGVPMEDTERSATINAVNALIPQFEYLYNLWAVKPSDPDALELNAMLKRWVDCGAWAEWDLVYVPSIHDQDAGDVDWTNGGPFSLDRFGGLVWTAFEGYTGNSTDAYLLTNWVAISHAVHYENKGDDASFMVFSLTDDPNNGGDIFGAKSRLSLTPNGQAVAGSAVKINNGTNIMANIGSRKGMSFARRIVGGNQIEFYRDKVLSDSQSVNISATAIDEPLALLARYDAGAPVDFFEGNLAFFAIGASLTPAQADEVTDAFVDWLTYKGVLP